MQKEKLEQLALEKNHPCVTVSLNTHRTFPDNKQDIILLKNLLSEARERVIKQFGKRGPEALLEKIENIEKNTDNNYNLNSMHIFISGQTAEIIKSPLPASENSVHVSDSFAIKPLIKMLNQTEDYLILFLSQSGVQLYHAINDSIDSEIRNEDFPFDESPYYHTAHDKLSDPETVDNMVRQFLNLVDKSVLHVYNERKLKCVVVCTEDNYSRLMQVTDNVSMYYGYVPVNYNNTALHSIASQAWEMVSADLNNKQTSAIKEVQDAVGAGLVSTDLREIYRAAKEGRGDLLIVDRSFSQAAIPVGEFDLEFSDNKNAPGVIDDITSEIAWQVLSKKGRVIFTPQEELHKLGKIVLKLRY
jgi:hypothetical protein